MMCFLINLRGAATAVVALTLCAVTIAQSGGGVPSIDVSRMDKTCQPCEDFYMFANGAWLKKNPVPPDVLQKQLSGIISRSQLSNNSFEA